MSGPKNPKTRTAINRFFDHVNKARFDMQSVKEMQAVGGFALGLIIKRTRIGYGVSEFLADKERLKRLSPKYIKARQSFQGLDSTTTPAKSNLTRTGQMLRSTKVTRVTRSTATIEPTGTRDDGLTNKEVAAFQEEQGRTYLNVSRLEQAQILRFYRKSFRDLLRKRKLLR